jgi:predicted transcriptional regulator
MVFRRRGKRAFKNVQNKLRKTNATRTAFKAQEESGAATAVPVAKSPSLDWRTSITRRAITCMECGESLKQLSIHHLRVHGLDPRSYRAKYGFPQMWPLASLNTAARRRRVIYKARPWEKSPRCRKGQVRGGTASPKPEAEVAHAKTEKPTVAAP